MEKPILSATLLKAKNGVGRDSPVYKDVEGKWRLAQRWTVTSLEVKNG